MKYLCKSADDIRLAIRGDIANSKEILDELVVNKQYYVAILNQYQDERNNSINLFGQMLKYNRLDLFKELISEVNYNKKIFNEYNVFNYIMTLVVENYQYSLEYINVMVEHIIKEDLSFKYWCGSVFSSEYDLYHTDLDLLLNMNNTKVSDCCIKLLCFSDKNIEMNTPNAILGYFHFFKEDSHRDVMIKKFKNYFNKNKIKYNELKNNLMRFIYVLNEGDIIKLNAIVRKNYAKNDNALFFKSIVAKMESQSLSEDYNGIEKGRVLKV